MHIAVLGSGVVGLTSAWALRMQGHEVTVIDRQAGPARETSFANGAQVSAGHAEPWAQPGVLKKVLRWLPKEDAPLLFRMRLDPALWRWGLAFIGECRPSRFEKNLHDILALGVYSRQCLQSLRDSLGLHYDEQSGGILNVYEDWNDYRRARAIVERIQSLGYPRQLISLEEALEKEPALRHRAHTWVGATWTPPDETGDAHQFAEALYQHALTQGIAFRWNTHIDEIQCREGRVFGIRFGKEILPVDGAVVALGVHSRALLSPLRIALPLYPAKGYSATLTLLNPAQGPRASVTDEATKMVFTRLGDRLRIAGTAEFNGYSLDLNPARCKALVERGRLLFPGAAQYAEAQFWTGLRPATPSNKPLIGETHIAGLYLNTGHGTLGWTEACGSAMALADLIVGRKPAVNFPFLKSSER